MMQVSFGLTTKPHSQTKGCLGFDTKQDVMVKLLFSSSESVEYPLIPNTPRSTLIQSGSTCSGLIYELNRSV